MQSATASTVPPQLSYRVVQGFPWCFQNIICDVDGEEIDFSGWTAVMDIRSCIKNELKLTLSTANSRITLSSVGVISFASTVDALTATIPCGNYVAELVLINPDLKPTPYLRYYFEVVRRITVVT